jgi:hypothetical protein
MGMRKVAVAVRGGDRDGSADCPAVAGWQQKSNMK